MASLCVDVQEDQHERQRYEKQTDRQRQNSIILWQKRNFDAQYHLAGVQDRSGPGCPFGDFSGGTEKSLGPEAETL
ncbi:MAG: hypothetical protein IIT47_03370, partial [Oscillospiraceae bacterium]|nr:hypothetical protein [Oscillospiraceae bacterium]